MLCTDTQSTNSSTLPKWSSHDDATFSMPTRVRKICKILYLQINYSDYKGDICDKDIDNEDHKRLFHLQYWFLDKLYVPLELITFYYIAILVRHSETSLFLFIQYIHGTNDIVLHGGSFTGKIRRRNLEIYSPNF